MVCRSGVGMSGAGAGAAIGSSKEDGEEDEDEDDARDPFISEHRLDITDCGGECVFDFRQAA